MRLRGGEISEDLLDQKLHVATNYMDRLAQKFKLDFDLLGIGCCFTNSLFVLFCWLC